MNAATQASVSSRAIALSARQAPGPTGFVALGALLELRRDPLAGVLALTERYGPLVRVPLARRSFYLSSHHADARRVLCDNAQAYSKQTFSFEELRSVLGDGLITSEGPRWREQRRSVNPAFQRALLPRLTPIVVERAGAMAARWLRAGGSIELGRETKLFALETLNHALLGVPDASSVAGIERHLGALLAQSFARTLRPLNLPRSWPTLENQRFLRQRAALEQAVLELVELRRKGEGSGADLIGRLLSSAGEDGAPLERRALGEQVATFLLAGHETTGNLLAFSLAHIARSPEVEARLLSELEATLAGRDVTFDDLPKLGYCRAVIEETARLHPPVWLVERRALSDDVLSGYRVPRGAAVAVCQYALHRDPRVWPEAERFLPERFLGSERHTRPPHAYLPFGSGARSCIGGALAMTVALSTIATVLQHARLRAAFTRYPEAVAGVTLSPRGPLMARVLPSQR